MNRSMPAKLRWSIFRRDGFRCTYCGRTAKQGVELHVDHIVAWSDGGTDDPSNLTTACSDCNLGKHAESLPTVDFSVRVGECCPTRLWIAYIGHFHFGYGSYSHTWKACRLQFKADGLTMPPPDRRDRQVWTMVGAWHHEWQAAVLASA